MTKYKLEAEQIEMICQELKNNYKSSWIGEDETKPTLEFKDKTIKGKITFDDTTLDIKGATLIKKFESYKKIVDDAEKNKIKEEELEKGVFKKLLETEIYFNGLSTNKDLIKKIDKELKKFDIGEIRIRGILQDRNTFNSDNILIGIQCNPDDVGIKEAPRGFFTRLKTFLLEKYPLKDYEKETFDLPEISLFSLLNNEKTTDINIDTTKVGVYYPERNFIHLFYNPFEFTKITPFTDDIPAAVKDLLSVFQEIKIKKNDISDIQKKILLNNFIKKSKEKENALKSSIKANERQVTDYGNSIRRCVENIHSDTISLEFIKSLMNSSGEQLFKEIDKINKLPFVKKVDITSGEIDVLFKETCIPIPNMLRSDVGKGYGKRYVYIGEVGFHISPGEFKTYGNCPIKDGHPHPHASSSQGGESSSPCFGDGDGYNKIYSLLSQYNFSELAKMLWFWIKTYRNKGAYVKVWDTYDDRLMKGYPVFDEKGKRIEINDPERIKTGEQRELKKHKDYKKNKEKYKHIKL